MQPKEMTKLYKILIFISAIANVGIIAGGYLYLPKRLEKLETLSAADHDTLIEVKADVRNINRRLETKGIVIYETNTNVNSYSVFGRVN